jgi:hypothetical protein
MSLEPEGLAEKPVGQRIARLAAFGRCLFEEVDCPWR